MITVFLTTRDYAVTLPTAESATLERGPAPLFEGYGGAIVFQDGEGKEVARFKRSDISGYTFDSES